MDLSKDKIKLVDNIYHDFLNKARAIEIERDLKIAGLFSAYDQQEIQNILKSLKEKNGESLKI